MSVLIRDKEPAVYCEAEIRKALEACDATPFMERIVWGIYECNGFEAALSCALSWRRVK